MAEQDIRWKQRFEQFKKAFALLESATAIKSPTVVERAGLVQFFEMAFELGWKLLKDYQQAEGFDVTSPRDAIKQAFQSGLVTAGHDWINALEDRNLTTHTYNEQTAVAVVQKIRDTYHPLLVQLAQNFEAKLNDEK